MLYYNFNNYEEFKELFGLVKHGNGVKSRKNKILLSFRRLFTGSYIRYGDNEETGD